MKISPVSHLQFIKGQYPCRKMIQPDDTRYHCIEEYLNNHHFSQWLNENFDNEQIINLLDTIADDGVFPQEFVDYCYTCLQFDNGHSVYPVLVGNHTDQPIDDDEEEIDHEFHFMEAPVYDDNEYNFSCMLLNC